MLLQELSNVSRGFVLLLGDLKPGQSRKIAEIWEVGNFATGLVQRTHRAQLRVHDWNLVVSEVDFFVWVVESQVNFGIYVVAHLGVDFSDAEFMTVQRGCHAHGAVEGWFELLSLSLGTHLCKRGWDCFLVEFLEPGLLITVYLAQHRI